MAQKEKNQESAGNALVHAEFPAAVYAAGDLELETRTHVLKPSVVSQLTLSPYFDLSSADLS